jgi:hypothetical protein
MVEVEQTRSHYLFDFLEKQFSDTYYQDFEGYAEVGCGDKQAYNSKEDKYCNGYFSSIYWSKATGWSQVLYYSKNPQSEIEIRRIDFYPYVIDAIQDISIFPEHCWVSYFPQ